MVVGVEVEGGVEGEAVGLGLEGVGARMEDVEETEDEVDEGDAPDVDAMMRENV